MLTKFKEGLLWGFGFSISVVIVLYGFSSAEEWLTRSDPYTPSKPIKGVPYEILNDAYRIAPSSDEFKGGLVISGTVKFKALEAYENLELVAFVTGENGVYIDTCSDYGLMETPVNSEFYFKLMCQHVTSKDQFEKYEFELRGNKI